ncbi:MAG: TIGR03905 family TSCPD domain-containing protein [Eubacteriales bacterium]
MKTLTYKTRGTCSRSIEICVENNIIQSVRFEGGCHGNTQGVAALVKGMSVDEAISRLSGIDCRGRGTSCPDQLSKALIELKDLPEAE